MLGNYYFLSRPLHFSCTMNPKEREYQKSVRNLSPRGCVLSDRRIFTCKWCLVLPAPSTTTPASITECVCFPPAQYEKTNQYGLGRESIFFWSKWEQNLTRPSWPVRQILSVLRNWYFPVIGTWRIFTLLASIISPEMNKTNHWEGRCDSTGIFKSENLHIFSVPRCRGHGFFFF